MATITFTSADYKDRTVYAVAGSHTETVLMLARANKIPINFSCENGECGTCVIKVSSLDKKERMGGPLTDKEKNVLREIGKISAEDVENMEINDLPTPWRLACQMIVRDEELLIQY